MESFTDCVKKETSKWKIEKYVKDSQQIQKVLEAWQDVEAPEPKWVNFISNVIGVTSLRPVGLNVYISRD